MRASTTQVNAEIARIAELGAASTSRAALRAAMLARLRDVVGADFAVIWSGPGDADATVLGFDEGFFAHFAAAFDRFSDTIGALGSAALAAGGAVADQSVFDDAARSRLPFYGEIIRPIGSRSFLTARLQLHGRDVGLLQLGRASRGRALDDDDDAVLRRLLPVTAIADAAAAPRRIDPDAFAFTPREREIVELVVLGFDIEDWDGVFRYLDLGPASQTTARAAVDELKRELGV